MPSPDDIRHDPERLAALRRLDLLDLPAEETFDQFTHLAVEILGVPAAFVSLVDAERDVYLSQCGFGEPLASTRQITGRTFCHYAIQSEAPLVIPDTRADPVYREVPTVESLGVAAYVGVPLLLPTREVLGSFCVIDTRPHQWTEAEIRAVEGLARAVTNEIMLRDEISRRAEAEAELRDAATLLQDQTLELENQLEDSQALAEELELANAELQESQQRLLIRDHAIAAATEGILITDARVPDDPIIYANPGFERLTGYGADEILGRNCRFLQGEGTDPVTVARIRDALQTRRPFRGAILNYRKDGTPFWNDLSMTPVLDGQGETTHFVGIQHDITERMQAEEALRGSEERFRQIAENVRDVFWIFTPDFSETLYVSPALEAVTGIPPAALYRDARAFLEPVHPDDLPRLLAAMEKIRHEGVIGVEFRLTARDGSLRWFRARGFPVRGPDGEIDRVVGTSEDITEQRVAEGQLRQAQKMEAVGLLAGGVAHDFNNLLTAITGYAQLLRMEGNLTVEQESFLGEVLAAARRSSDLTHQLLAFSRKQMLQPRTMDLAEVVLDTTKMLKRLIGEDIRIHTVLDPHLDAVLVDPGQMGQVLMNLAVNARDAMPRGGVLTISTTRLQLSEARQHGGFRIDPGRYAVMTVADTGVGMSAQTQARVFEPFFTTKPVGQGTGLGLAMVYGIVKQSGGYVTVESEPGRGSVFAVILPAVESEAPVAPADEVGTDELSRGTETILVVEDDAAVRTLAAFVLEQSGYRVSTAENGYAALEAARGKPLDLVLTDVVMPQLSGRALADQLRELRPSLRVLYMSGYTADAIVRHGVLEAGIHLLRKPFTPAELTRKVRAVLDAAAPPGQ